MGSVTRLAKACWRALWNEVTAKCFLANVSSPPEDPPLPVGTLPVAEDVQTSLLRSCFALEWKALAGHAHKSQHIRGGPKPKQDIDVFGVSTP
eukprot:3158405-Pyramimonas_sp.AAC.1